LELRQQIIQDRIETLASNLNISRDFAFLRFAHSLITGQSIHAFSPADLVDGGEDKQIDVITMERQGDNEAIIYILQAKNTPSFSSNSLIQMRNGLRWLFNTPRAELNKLNNIKFRDKIVEYRSEWSTLGPSNIHVVVAFVTYGLTRNLSDEFLQEERAIRYDYDNGTFAKFDLLIWGADELVNQLNMIEKKDRKIDANIRIRYDTNNPSLIKYHAEGLRGIVCSAAAHEIAQIVNNDPTGSVFDSNIRRFLGTRGAVNAGILKTCTDPVDSHQFWFLNNGITIVCESFDPVTDPDNPHIKLKNMQIVNGCQTATTLALAEREGKLVRDAKVLLRIYEAPSSDLVDKIVLTTNNQNKIYSRDLHANDPVQVDMERAFLTYNYYYERKPHQYDNRTDVNMQHVLANEIVAQTYLAIVLKKPVDARAYKQRIWGELYDEIFSGKPIEPYVIAVLIYRCTQTWIRQSGNWDHLDIVPRKLAANGTFFVARIASFLWRKGDKFSIERTLLQQQILTLETDPNAIDEDIHDAFEHLVKIIENNEHYLDDLDRALKSTTLNGEIDRVLYS